MRRKSLDSLQKEIINKIKYKTKTDLNYSFMLHVDGTKRYYMNCPERKYGSTFRYYVHEWVDVVVNSYGRHVNKVDYEIIKREIDTWIAKVEKQVKFL